MLVLTIGLLAGCSEEDCGDSRACEVTDGQYFAHTPDGDGPWPVWMHLHGGGGSAASYDADSELRTTAAAQGYLLILPEAVGSNWRLQPYTNEEWAGVPWDIGDFVEVGRDDLDYIEAVLDDAEARFWVTGTVLLSGFSMGGSMTWDLSCLRSERLTAAAPYSGGFWDPIPAECPGAAIPTRHVHGTADETVPLEGRQFTDAVGQGDIFEGWAVLTERAGCQGETTAADDLLSCTVHTDCATDMRLCLHDGAHRMPDGWAQRTVDWYESL